MFKYIFFYTLICFIFTVLVGSAIITMFVSFLKNIQSINEVKYIEHLNENNLIYSYSDVKNELHKAEPAIPASSGEEVSRTGQSGAVQMHSQGSSGRARHSSEQQQRHKIQQQQLDTCVPSPPNQLQCGGYLQQQQCGEPPPWPSGRESEFYSLFCSYFTFLKI